MAQKVEEASRKTDFLLRKEQKAGQERQVSNLKADFSGRQANKIPAREESHCHPRWKREPQHERGEKNKTKWENANNTNFKTLDIKAIL